MKSFVNVLFVAVLVFAGLITFSSAAALSAQTVLYCIDDVLYGGTQGLKELLNSKLGLKYALQTLFDNIKLCLEDLGFKSD